MTNKQDENDKLKNGVLPANADPFSDLEPIDAQPETPSTKHQPSSMLPSLGDFTPSVLGTIQRRKLREESPIQTPWSCFSNQLQGGFWPGVHVLIAGTAAGKTQFALECSLHAAMTGSAVGYVSLELNEEDILARVASTALKKKNITLPWSKIYRGEINEEELSQVQQEFEIVRNLPFYVDFGTTTGWATSKLEKIACSMKECYPNAPIFLVVDFLQLVGNEPNERADLRERIGKAAYLARQVARQHRASILLISSTARANYNLFAPDTGIPAAGLMISDTSNPEHRFLRGIRSPDALVGLGKETGEIEYAADSVTILAKLPRDLIVNPSEYSPVLAITAKLRAGPPSWCVLGSNGWNFAGWNGQDKQIVEAIDSSKRSKKNTSSSESNHKLKTETSKGKTKQEKSEENEYLE